MDLEDGEEGGEECSVKKEVGEDGREVFLDPSVNIMGEDGREVFLDPSVRIMGEDGREVFLDPSPAKVFGDDGLEFFLDEVSPFFSFLSSCFTFFSKGLLSRGLLLLGLLLSFPGLFVLGVAGGVGVFT